MTSTAGDCKISAMRPGMHVKPHTGQTNRRAEPRGSSGPSLEDGAPAPSLEEHSCMLALRSIRMHSMPCARPPHGHASGRPLAGHASGRLLA